MEAEQSSLPPTWKKIKCVHATVARMTVKEKRRIYALMRSERCTHDMLLVPYGMTLGDFCCMNILSDTDRRVR